MPTTERATTTPFNPETSSERACAKCKEVLSTVHVRNVFFCTECFVDSVVHRFRCSIIKSKFVPEEQMDKRKQILLAFSGGASSSSLIQLANEYHCVDERKKARFSGFIVGHVDESALYICPDVSSLVQDYNFSLVISKLEDVFTELPPNARKKALLECMQKTTSISAQEELVKIFRMHLLRKMAFENECHGIFLGDNNSRIAINVIANTSKGKGYNLPLDIASETDWFHGVFIMRPFHNIDAKEIGLYTRYKNIRFNTPNDLTTMASNHASIDKLTEAFILGLQEEFPSTVSTITRTASKITTGCYTKGLEKCQMCQSAFQGESHFWKAKHSIDHMPGQEPTTASVDFSQTCYACQITLREQKIPDGDKSRNWDISLLSIQE